ncbi:chemotaxis protein CheB [Thioclava sp. BHET1]|nr:chemotaxis protein CheB [Thioclava sp. BHET1]
MQTQPDPFYIVGIGASAGGLEAISELLEPARANDPYAFVVVQHLDPNHDSLLAELLDRQTELSVRQAEDGTVVQVGHVYTIPPGSGLRLEQGVLRLEPFEQPRGLRRPIDDFFESLARDQQNRAICVILSGTGSDGSVGLRALKEYGGLCIAQDASARYDSMPNSAVATGLVDFVCAPGEVTDRIARYRNVDPAVVSAAEAVPVSGTLAEICAALRQLTGHDFGNYKRSTLERRIQRRMQVVELTDSLKYLDKLNSDPREAEALLGDLLINVTKFFRDKDHFNQLREEVIAPLVAGATADREIRVWVPGCSSGEEAYTIAMLFDDEMMRTGKTVPVQVFASDIDERMLEIARAGRYPISALLDIPETLRDRYAIGREGSFQLNLRLRDMVRFSCHSLIKDPPFSRMDLISCRNLLIYFDDKLQSKVLPLFHYALNSEGFLFLGPSESIGRVEELFEAVSSKARLFKSTGGRSPYPVEFSGSPSKPRVSPRRPVARLNYDDSEWKSDVAKNRIIDIYAPPTMQLGRDGAILATTGRLSRYIETDPAETGQDFAQSVARPGLRESLSALLRSANQDGKRKMARDVEVISETGRQRVDVVADPLPDETILVVFRDRAPFEAISEEEFDEITPSESHVQVLEAELRATRSRLRMTVEELETANEELKSSNEEMMSMNEELQSTNEELATVNDELKSKVEELSQVNSDLRNFFDSDVNALITVDRKRRLRNFTEGASEVMRLRQSDRGRPINDLQFNVNAPEEIERQIEATLSEDEARPVQIRSGDGAKVWSLSSTPYRSADNKIDGVTLIFTDVTEAFMLERRLAREAERVRLAVEVAQIGIWSLDPASGLIEIDERTARFFGEESPGIYSAETLLDRVIESDRSQVWSAVTTAAAGGEEYDATFQVSLPSGKQMHLRGMGRMVSEPDAQRMIGLSVDITSEIENERMRELMLREMNHRVKNLFSIVSGMLRIASRKAETPRALVEDVTQRINALARSHDLARARRDGAKIALEELVRTTLSPYQLGDTVDIDGPPCAVGAEKLTSLALILHEWSTNAAKYGVLGPVAGRLQLRWSVVDDKKVTFEWNEIYDETLKASSTPSTPGFGSTLVQISAAQIGAEVTEDVTETHRTYRIAFDADEDI